ncbi:MAG: AAA family ATPase [Armatimonadota bacterium]|nr:AAA family ATPase [Armatimonadota bacterium]
MEAEEGTLKLLREVVEMVPEENQRLRNYLSTLEKALREDARKAEHAAKMIAEYEEAYEKLTSPANRTGVYLESMEDGIALIAVGDTEFVVSVDPKVDGETLQTGNRVKVNDAYAIVGALPPHAGGQVMKVAEVVGDNLRVSQDAQGTIGRIVLRAAAIRDDKIDVGDEVRIEPNFKVATAVYKQKETQDYYVEETPPIGWDEIGGQDHAIQVIRDTIEGPLLYPEIYEKFGKKPVKGILLYGPPGCGKTLIGKATAYNLTQEYSKTVGSEVKEYFMSISGPKILNMWLGESERMVREIFQIAREKAKEGRLVFIFFDEAESLLRTRSSGRWLNISNTIVPQFCAELDGLVSLENVVVILTSNRPDYIDPAVLRPERIDRKVKIARPDQEAVREIFGIHFHANTPLDPEALAAEGGDAAELRQCMVDTITSYLWRSVPETEFLRIFYRNGGSETLHWRDLVSGALIKSVVERAKDFAIKRSIAEPKINHGVRIDDLRAAVKAEYSENEIFPKSDAAEDWLKLLDVPEENVGSVKPIRDEESGPRDRVI